MGSEVIQLKHLKNSDEELYRFIEEEMQRQKSGIEMIASESFVPMEIMEIQGSILTNKTMEGFPGRRYHAGHEAIDKIETLGIKRAKDIYGAEHANIQPHSGSQANQSEYAALIKPGDTLHMAAASTFPEKYTIQYLMASIPKRRQLTIMK